MTKNRIRSIRRIRESREPGCDPDAYWSIRLRRDELRGTHDVEVRFYCRDGSRQNVLFPAADRTSPNKILSLLNSHNARLPENGKMAAYFVGELIRAIPSEPIISTGRPGWRDEGRGFVLPQRMYGTARGNYAWAADAPDGRFAAMAGTLSEYRRGVLGPAGQSSFMTVAVLIGLASPLLSYVEARRGQRLLPETALIHWAGVTSSGKSTLARVTQSVVGPPGELCDYRATARGVAEECHAHNDLVAIFDEAEYDDASDQDLFKKMKLISQYVTSGRSKRITTALKNHLPDLQWTCFGISTGPMTQAAVSHRLSSLRHGQVARFLDLTVPPPDVGGIFDSMSGDDSPEDPSAASARRLQIVEQTMAKNHGVLLDAWIKYLLANDVAEQVEQLTDRFATELAGDAGGLTGRVARKVAVLYAAAVIGIEAGLLPWSTAWAKTAVWRFHRNALANRDPEAAEVGRAIRRVGRCIRDRRRFPRIKETSRGVPEFTLVPDAIGFLVKGERGTRGFLFPDRLSSIGVYDERVQKRIAHQVCSGRVNGVAALSQQFRVLDPQGELIRVRARRFTPVSLKQALKAAGPAEVVEPPPRA